MELQPCKLRLFNRKLRKTQTSVIDCGRRTMAESQRYVILSRHKTPYDAAILHKLAVAVVKNLPPHLPGCGHG